MPNPRPDGAVASREEALEQRRLIRFAVKQNANRHLRLYLRTGDGLLIWHAYAEYRRHKLPVPENVLHLLDQVCFDLLHAGTVLAKHPSDRIPVQVAKALGMVRPGGGTRGAHAVAQSIMRRDIVEAVYGLMKAHAEQGKRITRDDAYKQIAAARGEDKRPDQWKHIKQVVIGWERPRKK